ncbi:MAG: hypothetical protein GY866_01015 [Proteobacteria bacterium]|nr:hypothetical protein [Pseudomonadota bacterium]
MKDNLVPDQEEIFRWIETVFEKGIRRPGYRADRWAEEYTMEVFKQVGLENVRLEPVALPYWEPRSCSLKVFTGSDEFEVPCFPLPHSAPTDGLDLPLVAYDPEAPETVPLVNYLTAPFYLFDESDTLDKIHRPSLVPITRATIRLIDSTGGVSARQMRDAMK